MVRSYAVFIIAFYCVCKVESCLDCAVNPSVTLEQYKRDGYWWKKRAQEVRERWQTQREERFRIRFGSKKMLVSSRHSNDNPIPDIVPPVVNPTWDSPIPKFNCAILLKTSDNETPLCSGALISKKYVVTVGTGCVVQQDYLLYSPDDLLVRFVSYDQGLSAIITYDHQVTKLVLHEGYFTSGIYLAKNDIAILQLDSSMFYDDYIRPARITKRRVLHHPAVNDNWDLSNFRVFHRNISRVCNPNFCQIMAVDFRDSIWFVRTSFISTNVCDQVIKSNIFHKLQLTCASYFHMGSENCLYDQGSPLSYQGELIGLLIYKQDCGGPEAAALFVNIGVQSTWIRKTVQMLSRNEESV